MRPYSLQYILEQIFYLQLLLLNTTSPLINMVVHLAARKNQILSANMTYKFSWVLILLLSFFSLSISVPIK